MPPVCWGRCLIVSRPTICGLQGECKYTIVDEGHSEWVSCVRFSPSPTAPVIVSCGWDKRVKVSILYI